MLPLSWPACVMIKVPLKMLLMSVKFVCCPVVYVTGTYLSEWFEPRSIGSLSMVIVWVTVVLKSTAGDSDRRFENLSGGHLQSQSDIVSSVDGICLWLLT